MMSVIMKKITWKLNLILTFNDDLPFNKPLKIHLMTITIRSAFEEDCKHYPKVFLDDAL